MLATLALALASTDPWTSYEKLVTANGRGVVVMNGSNDDGVVLDVFSDHLYQQYSADQDPVWDLLYDSYFALDGSWARSAESFDYRVGTGIVEVVRQSGELSATEVVFVPMDLAWPGYVQLLKLENTGSTERTVTVNSLNNHHLGDGDAQTGNEQLWVDDGSVIEQGATTTLGVRIDPLVAADTWACASVFDSPGAFSGDCGSAGHPWSGDDLVPGLQWSVTVPAGGTAWVGHVTSFFAGDPTAPSSTVEAWLAGRSPSELVDAEQAWWDAWHAEGTVPADLTDDETDVYRQALAFLKMGQVTDEGDAYGQIPASLPLSAPVGDFQHIWNITWVRDGAYAIRALTAAGYLEEAGAALAFYVQDKAGDYSDYLGGQDYGLSVCRLYGDGSEWSDDDGTGPNIELDNFGLFLWALGEWVDAGGDIGLVTERDVFAGVADVLANVVEEDGLVMADSSIWERHWNGYQKHFTYTSTWGVRGLREASAMAEALGDAHRADWYAATADDIQAGICSELVVDGVLLGNEEEAVDQAWDLAAVDAFNNGTLDAATDIAAATFAGFDEHLAVTTGHGYKRNDDGDLYDEQEWVMVDLRLAEAKRRGCDTEAAQAIEDWITEQALANHLIIPELMDPDTAAYAGPAPMMGFGSGLYVLALHNRTVAAADCADGITADCGELPVDTSDPGDTDLVVPDDSGQDSDLPLDSGHGGEPDDTADSDHEENDEPDGCGCAGTAPAGWLALLPLAWLRRHRRR